MSSVDSNHDSGFLRVLGGNVRGDPAFEGKAAAPSPNSDRICERSAFGVGVADFEEAGYGGRRYCFRRRQSSLPRTSGSLEFVRTVSLGKPLCMPPRLVESVESRMGSLKDK